MMAEQEGKNSWSLNRRSFLKGTIATFLVLSLDTLKAKSFASPSEEGKEYFYRGWEDLYRQKWTWDKVVKGTHTYANCAGGCEFDLYVKEGIVWREEQCATYTPTNDYLPDFNPRGCQKGACYSEVMYSPGRIKYPLKRAGQRGEAKWERLSWDQALDEISDKLLEIIDKYGSECVIHDLGTNIAVESGAHVASRFRFFDLIGGTLLDCWADLNDLNMGAALTWGQAHVDGTSDDWFNSDYIMLWKFNPVYTRIPEAHFLWEAKYNGATIVSIAPDLNASSIHASLWVNPRIGSDIALALGMAKVIIDENLHKPDYIKEQTDLPFLVRDDTGKFLREKDMEEGGKEHVYYIFDEATQKVVKAPGSMDHSTKSIRLNGLNPALEGCWEVTTHDGKKVMVRPVFEHLKKLLEDYTPEKASIHTEVNPEVIRKLARDYANAKAAIIISSWGSAKLYHSDLMQRSRILLSALCGHTGKPGGGYRNLTWYILEGNDLLAFPTVSQALQKSYKLPEEIEKVEELPVAMITPSALFLYWHGELKRASGRKEFGDTTMKRAHVDEYVVESVEKGWMPLLPPLDKQPKALFTCGGNPLRRFRATWFLREHLWPKLELIVDTNFKINTTGLNADYVLPAAGYYEKTGIKYPISYVPFANYGDKAVEPLFESKGEWEIFWLLAQKIQQKAIERGMATYTDPMAQIERDLKKLHEQYSEGGKFNEKDEKAINRHILENSLSTKGITLEALEEKGAIRFTQTGASYRPYGIKSKLRPNEALFTCERFVVEKEPWQTMTGRQQFYIDHDWYQEFGEALPVHKDSPNAGGSYPLKMTGGHTRWSIHSMWRDSRYMLRLQRGQPIMYMNPDNAKERGIQDHDVVQVYNDVNSFKIHAKLSPAVRRGQVIVYHAWEPFQYEGHKHHQVAIATPLKPLQLVGNYGHIRYGYGHCAPGQNDRDTTVEVKKA